MSKINILSTTRNNITVTALFICILLLSVLFKAVGFSPNLSLQKFEPEFLRISNFKSKSAKKILSKVILNEKIKYYCYKNGASFLAQ